MLEVLTAIKCVSSSKPSQILSVAADNKSPKYGSIASNNICYHGKMEGLIAICEMLKVNTTLKGLYLMNDDFDEAAEQQLRDAAKEREERTGVKLSFANEY